MEQDLYTTRFGEFESTEIEEKFFGKIDRDGKEAVEYFENFAHPSVDGDAVGALLRFMAAQKIRTPKGLDYLTKLTRAADRNTVLIEMQRLYQMFCAIWTESVWVVADACESPIKFIVTDHPVTVYNRSVFPASPQCRKEGDPPVWLNGTHTLFPLSKSKILILTNLSWVRNPYGNPLKERPNPSLFRTAMFKFQDVQTHRFLAEDEVIRINYILKARAKRYIAGADQDWLFPERKIGNLRWDKVSEPHLLMPDPRSLSFSHNVVIGMSDGRSSAFDAYGRRPGQPGYDPEKNNDREWNSFLAFQGEFARLMGPQRKGRSYQLSRLDPSEDSEDGHAYYLSLEGPYKARIKGYRRKKRK